MANGRRLGEAFIQVSPDTSGFGAKTAADVDRATAGQSAEIPLKLDRSEFDKTFRTVQARLAAFSKQAAEGKLGLDATQARAELLRLTARVEAFAAKRANAKVGIEGSTRAQAELAGLSAAMDAFGRKSETAGRKMVTANRQASASVTPLRKNLFGLAGTISGVDRVSNKSGKSVRFLSLGLLGLNVATGVGEAGVSALIGSTAALSSALVAAGLGLGAYGAAVIPLVSKVAKLRQAQAAAAQGSAAAAQKVKDMLATMPPALKQFNKAFDGAAAAYTKWSDSLAGPALAPLTHALGLANPLLQRMRPFVLEAAKALDQLVREMGQGIRSTGFEHWLRAVLPLVRPSIVGIGHAIGNIVLGLGGIVRAFAPFAKSVVGGLDHVTAAFAHWGQTLSSHSGFQALVEQWKRNWPLMRTGLKSLVTILVNIARSFAGIATPANSRLLWQVANPLLALAAKLSGNTALVQAFLYLILIGKGAKQISGVFAALKAGWAPLAKTLSLLTGGKINLGMQGAGDTMLVASRNMQEAAAVMSTASKTNAVAGAEGAGGGALGAAEGAAAGAGAKGFITRFLGRFGGVAVRALGTIGIAALITELVVKPILKHFVQDPKHGTTLWDRPTGSGPKGSSGWENWSKAINNQSIGVIAIRAGKSAAQKWGHAFMDVLTHIPLIGPAVARRLQVPKDAVKSVSGAVQNVIASQARLRDAMKSTDSVFANQQRQAVNARNGLNAYDDAVRKTGKNSLATRSARRTLIGDLEQAGVKAGKARRDVNNYNDAVRANGINSSQAHAARRTLVKDISDAVTNSHRGRREVTGYTQAVRSNGDTSAQARSARRNLINDLIRAGLSSKEAHRQVYTLTQRILAGRAAMDRAHHTSLPAMISDLQGMGKKAGFSRGQIATMISKILAIPRRRVIDIIEHGNAYYNVQRIAMRRRALANARLPQGSGGLGLTGARGMKVPGRGHGDTVPAMLTPGEAVVPRHLVPALAPFLKRHGVPGFASGGKVGYHDGTPGLGDFTQRRDKAFLGLVTRTLANEMDDALVAAMRAAARAAQSRLAASVSSSALGGDASKNRALARRIFPWGASQWPPFVALEMQEAGFNRLARNRSSGAYGIPQALPPTKLPFAGQAAGGSHAGPQLSWMFNYIRARYGTPAGAWAHEQRFNWYSGGGRVKPVSFDRGGWLPPRSLTLASNSTSRAERVGGGPARLVLEFQPSGTSDFDRFMFNWVKRAVSVRGGGDVQLTFGQSH